MYKNNFGVIDDFMQLNIFQNFFIIVWKMKSTLLTIVLVTFILCYIYVFCLRVKKCIWELRRLHSYQTVNISINHQNTRDNMQLAHMYRPAMLRQLPTCRLLISGRATNTNPWRFLVAVTVFRVVKVGIYN